MVWQSWAMGVGVVGLRSGMDVTLLYLVGKCDQWGRDLESAFRQVGLQVLAWRRRAVKVLEHHQHSQSKVL